MGGLPSEAMEVLQRLSASNEGVHRLPDKLALLERRLTVPPSPVVSREGAGSLLLNQNSVHSVTQQPSFGGGQGAQRHATPSLSNSQQPAGPLEGARSFDGLEAGTEHASKRRRVQQPAGEAGLGRAGSKPVPAGASSRGGSPPAAAQQQQRLSPFLAADSKQQQQPTPGSSKKQTNKISRYFPTISGGGGAVAGGGGVDATAAAPPRRAAGPSPAVSDQQAAPVPVSAVVQALQLEAARLR